MKTKTKNNLKRVFKINKKEYDLKPVELNTVAKSVSNFVNGKGKLKILVVESDENPFTRFVKHMAKVHEKALREKNNNHEEIRKKLIEYAEDKIAIRYLDDDNKVEEVVVPIEMINGFREFNYSKDYRFKWALLLNKDVVTYTTMKDFNKKLGNTKAYLFCIEKDGKVTKNKIVTKRKKVNGIDIKL